MKFFTAISLLSVTRLIQANSLLGFDYTNINDDILAELNQTQWEATFRLAQSIPGNFNAGRIWSSINHDGTNYTSAFPAAVTTKTQLMIPIGSGDNFSELIAVHNAISDLGSSFTDLIKGVLVGNDDVSFGTPPATVAANVAYVRKQLQGTALANVPIGTSNYPDSWTNTTTQQVIDVCDFIGVEINTPAVLNTTTVDQGVDWFNFLMSSVKAVAQGKPLWIVSVGWPAVGAVADNEVIVPSISDAEAFWHDAGCKEIFNQTTIFWGYLQKNLSPDSSQSSGILDSNGQPLYNLSCSAAPASPTSSSTASAATGTATGLGTASTSPSGSSPTSDSSSNTATASQSSGGLSSAAKVGVGVGVGVGGALIIAAIAAALLWRSKQQNMHNEKLRQGPGLAMD